MVGSSSNATQVASCAPNVSIFSFSVPEHMRGSADLADAVKLHRKCGAAVRKHGRKTDAQSSNWLPLSYVLYFTLIPMAQLNKQQYQVQLSTALLAVISCSSNAAPQWCRPFCKLACMHTLHQFA